MAYLKHVLALCFMILVGAGAYVGFDLYRIGHLPFVPSPLQRACVDLLEDRLKAPSTLKIIEVNHYIKPMSIEEAESQLRQDSSGTESDAVLQFELTLLKDKFKDESQRPLLYEVFLTTDADNSFGTPLRSVSHCTLAQTNGSYPSSFDLQFKMKLDGFDRTEWLAEQAKQLKQ